MPPFPQMPPVTPLPTGISAAFPLGSASAKPERCNPSGFAAFANGSPTPPALLLAGQQRASSSRGDPSILPCPLRPTTRSVTQRSLGGTHRAAKPEHGARCSADICKVTALWWPGDPHTGTARPGTQTNASASSSWVTARCTTAQGIYCSFFQPRLRHRRVDAFRGTVGKQ